MKEDAKHYVRVTDGHYAWYADARTLAEAMEELGWFKGWQGYLGTVILTEPEKPHYDDERNTAYQELCDAVEGYDEFEFTRALFYNLPDGGSFDCFLEYREDMDGRWQATGLLELVRS